MLSNRRRKTLKKTTGALKGQKQIAQVFGISITTLQRCFAWDGVEIGVHGMDRVKTMPIRIRHTVLYALVVRFLTSRSKIPFAIRAKICYNYTRWASAKDLYIPMTVLIVAKCFDPVKQKLSYEGSKKILYFKQLLNADRKIQTRIVEQRLYINGNCKQEKTDQGFQKRKQTIKRFS